VSDIDQHRKTHRRILVAEDNSVNQLVVARLLAQNGFRHVDIVSDGNQAFDGKFAFMNSNEIIAYRHQN